jgi:hypothetical protein
MMDGISVRYSISGLDNSSLHRPRDLDRLQDINDHDVREPVWDSLASRTHERRAPARDRRRHAIPHRGDPAVEWSSLGGLHGAKKGQ